MPRAGPRKVHRYSNEFKLTAVRLLKGDRRGQHSIRINAQWRICFEWSAEGPSAVEIVDYH